MSKPADCDHCGVPLASGDERHWCGECRGTACGKCRDAIKGVTERAGCWIAERREKKAKVKGAVTDAEQGV